MAEGRGKTVRSVAWSALEGGGLSIISFLSLVAFSRILAPTDFGLFATALSLLELLSLISNLAFHDALVQIPAITDRHKNTAFTITMLLSLVFCGLFWAVSPLFSMLMHDPRAGLMLGTLGGAFILNGFSATLTAQQRRNMEFKTLAIRSLVGRTAGAALGIVAAFMGMGVWSLVIQQLCVAGLGSAVLWIACNDRPRLGFDRDAARQLTVFGVAAAGAEFVNSGIKRVFVMACGVLLGANTAGYINLAFRMVDTLWGVSAIAIYQVILPIMSRAQDDRSRLVQLFRQSQTLASTFLFAIYIGLGGASHLVIALLFGERWVPASGYVTAMCFMMLLQAPRMLTVPVLTALGRPRDVLTGYCAGIVYMLLAISLVPFSSASVAIGIWVGTEVVYAPVFAYLLWRRSGIGPIVQMQNIIRPLIAGLAMFATIRLVIHLLPPDTANILSLIACGVAGTTVFLALLALLDPRGAQQMIGEVQRFLPGRFRRLATPPEG